MVAGRGRGLYRRGLLVVDRKRDSAGHRVVVGRIVRREGHAVRSRTHWGSSRRVGPGEDAENGIAVKGNRAPAEPRRGKRLPNRNLGGCRLGCNRRIGLEHRNGDHGGRHVAVVTGAGREGHLVRSRAPAGSGSWRGPGERAGNGSGAKHGRAAREHRRGQSLPEGDVAGCWRRRYGQRCRRRHLQDAGHECEGVVGCRQRGTTRDARNWIAAHRAGRGCRCRASGRASPHRVAGGVTTIPVHTSSDRIGQSGNSAPEGHGLGVRSDG